MRKNLHVLCVCTAGQQRSPTAARILNEREGIEARAAGLHPLAEETVRQEIVDWADVVVAMNESEDGHKTTLENNFALENTPVYAFDIPDTFPREEPALVTLLTEQLETIFLERDPRA